MNLKKYFSGQALYGDDFNEQKTKQWFEDEKEGYSRLIKQDYEYEFHAINKIHGFNKLKNKKFQNVLSFGGASGDELLPIIDKIENVNIIEPSKELRKKSINGKKINYKTPSVNGKIDFPNNHFDLITCFGVLHHIPNVSKIISEFSKILKPGGYLLLREPIVSMGDWTKSRKGLTKRERGIPLNILRRIIKDNSFKIISERKILFPLLRRINFKNFKGGNSKFLVYLDYLLGLIFSWNNKYHAINFFHKIRPQSVFYVLEKR